MDKQVENIIESAELQCKASGSRLTAKRKLVLSALVHAAKAISAYEIIELCKEEFGESLPAMSVYRILEFLQEEGLVHKLDLANKYVACSHISCDHAHATSQFLICSECQTVKEVSISPSIIEQLSLNVEEAGFDLSGFQLEMNCICKVCSNKNATTAS